MLSNLYSDMCDPPGNYNSVTVKVEHSEYDTLETAIPVAQLNDMRYESESITDYSNYDQSFKNEMYQKMEQIIGDDSVIDFIESSIDKFLVGYTKEKSPPTEKLRKGAERQRVYRQNETQIQRNRRLEMAREYIKKKRQTETIDQRYERLKKQRERIRAIREAMKTNPEIYKVRKQIEAERMKLRRANESPNERMKRLEKSRNYSKKRRENEVYRILENEKNRLAHKYKRSDEAFRLQERQRDKVRKKIKKEIMEPEPGNHRHQDTPESLPMIPVPIVPCSIIDN